MTIDVNRELATLVLENPAFVPILERYRLDFCCQGKQSLAKACQDKGVDLEHLQAELFSVKTNAVNNDWLEAPLSEVIAHIQQRYHLPLRTELPSLWEKARKVAQVHGQEHTELHRVESLVGELTEELLHHTDKEDKVLFPWIRDLEKGEMRRGRLEDPVAVMEAEHKEAGSLLEQLRQATGDYVLPRGACTTYRLLFAGLEQFERDLHLHIHLENSVLFPRALALARG